MNKQNTNYYDVDNPKLADIISHWKFISGIVTYPENTKQPYRAPYTKKNIMWDLGQRISAFLKKQIFK